MDSMFVDYDDSLIGRIPYVDPYNFFGSTPGGANERKALSCIRYVIEKVLCWDRQEANKKFDSYIIRIMKLEKIITYINFPVDIPYGHPRYILHLLYPNDIRLDKQKMAEEIFRNVLDASRNNPDKDDDESLKQFPRDYFAGGEGFKRFCYCIKYLIEHYKPMSSIEEIYDFFTSPQGKKLLFDFRLKVPADQFSIDMMDVIHYITRNDPDCELYYNYFVFKKELSSIS